MASISHRYSIRWLPEEASEPTSTLVLTSSSGLYIDVRIKVDRAEGLPLCLPASNDPLLWPPKPSAAQETGDAPETADIVPSDSTWEVKLDWAFAGQSTSTKDSPRRCTWEHWVDSNTSLFADKPFEDSGAMYPREDGMTLEKGAMVNPKTGKETEYEEVWEDLPLTVSENLHYKHYALTLDHISAGGDIRFRAVVMQLGTWFQAVCRMDNRQTTSTTAAQSRASRWRFDDGPSDWKLIYNSGGQDFHIPTPASVEFQLRASNAKWGRHVLIDGRHWLCRELERRED